MPYYRVILNGAGILMSIENASAPGAVGFFTTRVVRASTESSAIKKAEEDVLLQWTSGPWAEANKGAIPKLTVEDVRRVGLKQALLSPKAGHSFYAAEK